MKQVYLAIIFCISFATLSAQTPFERVYDILSTKCQNSTCHSGTSSEALKFDGNENSVHAALFNVNASNSSSVLKHEKLVKPQHPYMSFLLRKVAGASFDTDLAVDSATEGARMLDINGQPLTNKEIEFIRQWVIFGAKKTYTSADNSAGSVPNWQLVSDYYDNPAIAFLPKPQRPAPGTGQQFRMGPIFLPVSGSIEQEWLQQQEVFFEYDPEVTEIHGYMNQQSHHFLLFKYVDSVSARKVSGSNAAPDANNLALVSFATHTSFDGNKFLMSGWQEDAEMVLPEGTGMMWDKHTYLDMNYHMKNYNATSVLPCDFYFNIVQKPRNPQTIPMLSQLVNNVGLAFFTNGPKTVDYNDPSNGGPPETRYIWSLAGHTHERGTGFDIYRRDINGQITDKIYDGTSVTPYTGGVYDGGIFGVWDHKHPPIEYFPALTPVQFGGTNSPGLLARASWNITDAPIFFSFQTDGEMELFYYMYTNQPLQSVGVNDPAKPAMYFEVMPNPMNHSGRLVYNLEKAATVEGSIVDITGKSIALVSEVSQASGLHEISLGDRSLSSGIYVAKLSVDGVSYTKKFVVTE